MDAVRTGTATESGWSAASDVDGAAAPGAEQTTRVASCATSPREINVTAEPRRDRLGPARDAICSRLHENGQSDAGRNDVHPESDRRRAGDRRLDQEIAAARGPISPEDTAANRLVAALRGDDRDRPALDIPGK